MLRIHADLVAECVGTYFLVFIGCGAIICSALVRDPVPVMTASLAFGLTVAVMVYTLGDISGAHINPAVTFGLALMKQFPLKRVPSYVAMQVLGALLASATLLLIFGNKSHLGATLLLNGTSVFSGFFIEVIATLLLVFVVIILSGNEKVPKPVVGFIIGGTVSADIFFAGPLTMASLNPACSLGPAIVSGTWADQWVFVVGPLVGAVAASILNKGIKGDTMTLKGSESSPTNLLRIGIIGGFLGAGKTTTILSVGKKIVSKYGKKVAVITNDQGEVLVDTKIMKDFGLATAEVVDGCFCCRFPDFITAVNEVTARVNPDIILAEPVGSCADIPSTVCEPLKRYYGGKFILAPFVVLVDPYRVKSLMEEGDEDEQPINFLLSHQIQEAEVLVINKTDLVAREELEKVEGFLHTLNGRASLYRLSAKEGSGIDELVHLVMEGVYISYSYPEIDYNTYGAAEAALGWFNGSCVIAAQNFIDIKKVIRDFLTAAARKVGEKKGEIAHLKIHFEDGKGFLKASMVSQDGDVSFTGETPESVQKGSLSINARIKLEPSATAQCITEAFEEIKRKYEIESAQWNAHSFSPPQPKPYYKIPTNE